MKLIRINLTDDGWEMLVNGVPSPRFARRMRNLQRLWSWTRNLVDLLLLGPSRWLAFGFGLLLVTGQLTIDVSTSANLRDAQVGFHLGPSHYSTLVVCASGQQGCPASALVTAAEAREVKGILLLLYLLGVGYTFEGWLKRGLEEN